MGSYAVAVNRMADGIAPHSARDQHAEQILLAEFAHELRTPLAAIAASAELLADRRHALSADHVRKIAEDLHRGSVWLQSFVENVFFADAVAMGRLHLRLDRIDMLEVLDDVRPLIAPLLEQRAQRLRVARRGIEARICGDRRRLAQVLLNLLSNASRHAPERSTIDVLIREHQRGVRVIVADRGPGLADARAADLFKLFYQGTAPRPLDGSGLGLGLAVVRSIVERHGGRVGAKNRRGGGASFSFELPGRSTAD